MNSFEKYVADMTKEIVIAKLSQSAPNNTNEDIGNKIGEMYLAIYNTILSGLKAKK